MLQQLQFDLSILRRFAAFDKQGRLAHAYLFIGPSDIGKGETALAIAKMVNCEGDGKDVFCDVCPSCLRISEGRHPDVYVIDNGEESIKIAEIQEILGRNKFKAFMARKKIFILENIEHLTLEAANAFLKTLEEPSADSLLLLTTAVPDRVLDTVRSRCQIIHFSPMSRDRLSRRLREEGNLSEAGAHFLAYFAQGCLGTARKLKENGFLDEKNMLIDGFILSRPEDPVIKKMLEDKEAVKRLLDIFLSWIRDALLIKTGVAEERLVHADRKEDLRRFEKKYTFEELKNIHESVVTMCRLLSDNLNIKIPMLIIGEQIWER